MIIDVNANLSRWPFRRLKYDETNLLVDHLHEKGVRQAWVGSYDGLLHKDLTAVNERLAKECDTVGRDKLQPIGEINPTLPGWEEDVQKCFDDFKMLGVRIHPDYHRLEYDDERIGLLCKMVSERNRLLQIVLRMEDERMVHKSVRVQFPDKSKLLPLIQKYPKLKFMLLNVMRDFRLTTVGALVTNGNVWVDFSMLEGIKGLSRLLKEIPLERIVFGSNAPFYHLESALLKLKESELAQVELEAIQFRNALKFIEM